MRANIVLLWLMLSATRALAYDANDPANCNGDDKDDGFPSINKLLAFSSKGISIIY